MGFGTTATINVNVNASAATAQLAAMAKQMAALNKTVATGTAASTASFARNAKAVGAAAAATGMFTASTGNMRTAMGNMQRDFDKGSTSFRNYRRNSLMWSRDHSNINRLAAERVKTLQTQYTALGKEVNGVQQTMAIRPTRMMREFGGDLMFAQQKAILFRRNLEMGANSMINWGKNTQWAGRQMMVGMGIPIGLAAAGAVSAFKDIEEASISFKRVYGDATTTAGQKAEALAKVQSGVAQEMTKYGIAVADTLDVSARAAATGAQGEDLIVATRETMRLATLGQMDYQKALEATIAAQSTFGIQASQMPRIIDFMNAAENQTILTMEDMSLAVPRAANAVKMAGGSFEDLGTMMTAFRVGGVQAEQAANALKSGIASMINPTETASKFAGEFGINLGKIVKDNKGDVIGMFKDLQKGLDGLSDVDAGRVLEQMFGKFQYSKIGAMMQNLAHKQVKEVERLGKASAAELAKMSATELDQIAASPLIKMRAAVEKLKAAAAPLGGKVLEFLTPLVEGMAKVADFFAGNDIARNILFISAGIAGLIGVGTMVTGVFANFFGTMIKGAMKTKAIFSRLMGRPQMPYMTAEQLEASTAAKQLSGSAKVATSALMAEAGAAKTLTSALNQLAGASGRAAAGNLALAGKGGGIKAAAAQAAPAKMVSTAGVSQSTTAARTAFFNTPEGRSQAKAVMASEGLAGKRGGSYLIASGLAAGKMYSLAAPYQPSEMNQGGMKLSAFSQKGFAAQGSAAYKDIIRTMPAGLAANKHVAHAAAQAQYLASLQAQQYASQGMSIGARTAGDIGLSEAVSRDQTRLFKERLAADKHLTAAQKEQAIAHVDRANSIVAQTEDYTGRRKTLSNDALAGQLGYKLGKQGVYKGDISGANMAHPSRGAMPIESAPASVRNVNKKLNAAIGGQYVSTDSGLVLPKETARQVASTNEKAVKSASSSVRGRSGKMAAPGQGLGMGAGYGNIMGTQKSSSPGALRKGGAFTGGPNIGNKLFGLGMAADMMTMGLSAMGKDVPAWSHMLGTGMMTLGWFPGIIQKAAIPFKGLGTGIKAAASSIGNFARVGAATALEFTPLGKAAGGGVNALSRIGQMAPPAILGIAAIGALGYMVKQQTEAISQRGADLAKTFHATDSTVAGFSQEIGKESRSAKKRRVMLESVTDMQVSAAEGQEATQRSLTASGQAIVEQAKASMELGGKSSGAVSVASQVATLFGEGLIGRKESMTLGATIADQVGVSDVGVVATIKELIAGKGVDEIEVAARITELVTDPNQTLPAAHTAWDDAGILARAGAMFGENPRAIANNVGAQLAQGMISGQGGMDMIMSQLHKTFDYSTDMGRGQFDIALQEASRLIDESWGRVRDIPSISNAAQELDRVSEEFGADAWEGVQELKLRVLSDDLSEDAFAGLFDDSAEMSKNVVMNFKSATDAESSAISKFLTEAKAGGASQGTLASVEGALQTEGADMGSLAGRLDAIQKLPANVRKSVTIDVNSAGVDKINQVKQVTKDLPDNITKRLDFQVDGDTDVDKIGDKLKEIATFKPSAVNASIKDIAGGAISGAREAARVLNDLNKKQASGQDIKINAKAGKKVTKNELVAGGGKSQQVTVTPKVKNKIKPNQIAPKKVDVNVKGKPKKVPANKIAPKKVEVNVKGNPKKVTAGQLAPKKVSVTVAAKAKRVSPEQIAPRTVTTNVLANIGQALSSVMMLKAYAQLPVIFDVIANTGAAQAAINALKVPTQSTHTVYINKVGSMPAGGGLWTPAGAVGGFAAGGWAKPNGGTVVGRGGPETDSIPARLSNGEFVIRAKAVDKYGIEFLRRINGMRYADGGEVQGFRGGGSPRKGNRDDKDKNDKKNDKKKGDGDRKFNWKKDIEKETKNRSKDAKAVNKLITRFKAMGKLSGNALFKNAKKMAGKNFKVGKKQKKKIIKRLDKQVTKLWKKGRLTGKGKNKRFSQKVLNKFLFNNKKLRKGLGKKMFNKIKRRGKLGKLKKRGRAMANQQVLQPWQRAIVEKIRQSPNPGKAAGDALKKPYPKVGKIGRDELKAEEEEQKAEFELEEQKRVKRLANLRKLYAKFGADTTAAQAEAMANLSDEELAQFVKMNKTQQDAFLKLRTDTMKVELDIQTQLQRAQMKEEAKLAKKRTAERLYIMGAVSDKQKKIISDLSDEELEAFKIMNKSERDEFLKNKQQALENQKKIDQQLAFAEIREQNAEARKNLGAKILGIKKYGANYRDVISDLSDEEIAMLESMKDPAKIKKYLEGKLQDKVQEKLLEFLVDPVSAIRSASDNMLNAHIYNQFNKQTRSQLEAKVGKKQYRVDQINRQIELEQRDIDDLNDAYEEQTKALDKIEQAQQRIATIERGRLSVAQALSVGDVAGAARALQQAKQDEANVARDQMRSAIEDRRNAVIEKNEDKIKALRKEARVFEDQIWDIENKIKGIEAAFAVTVADAVAKYEAQQMLIDAYRWSGAGINLGYTPFPNFNVPKDENLEVRMMPFFPEPGKDYSNTKKEYNVTVNANGTMDANSIAKEVMYQIQLMESGQVRASSGY